MGLFYAFRIKHLVDMFFETFAALWSFTLWLLARRTCSSIVLYAVRYSFDLYPMSGPHLLVAFQQS